MRERKKTRQVRAGTLLIGGEAPVAIQTMTNIPVSRVRETIELIDRLQRMGAQMVRVALRSEDDIPSLRKVLDGVSLPLSADIHFNYRIALAAIEAGISKVRINPGNIGGEDMVREVVAAARDHKVPIRIGVNSGSVDRKRFKEIDAESLVESAMEHVAILEDCDFTDIVVSLKSSNLKETIEANRLFSQNRDYPIHVGLTEAGYGIDCVVRSSLAIGSLLMEGIGDTIRVSMTGDPSEEIVVARKILEAVGERTARLRIISCPTCGRTDSDLDLLEIAQSVEKGLLDRYEKILEENDGSLTVAIMGCEVNGPGEAREADVGVAGGRNGKMILFAGGEKVRTVKHQNVLMELIKEIDNLLGL